VVLADAGRGDWVLCQVTSNAYGDPRAIGLDSADFVKGSLHRPSFARPGKLFTAHFSLVADQAGVLTSDKLLDIRSAVVQLIQSG
jgi:mRNA interferase MazF